MHPTLLCLLLTLPQSPSSAPPQGVAAQPQAAAPAHEPGFLSETRPFRLNDPIELNLSLSGIQVVSLTFRRERVEPGFFSFTEAPGLATRAILKVANTSGRARRIAFAIAVEDKEGRLISAVSTDRKPERTQTNKMEEIELRFTLLGDEAAKADHFKLVVEPRGE
ncbi:MAG TPA: hypothetical protein VJ600_03450, partial [Holophagaceae bacterium]|nr:hypothetical protein [Holophagaceae bacterium]